MSEWLLSTLLIVGRSGVGQAGTASDDSLRRSTAFAIGLQRKLRHRGVLIPDGKSSESLCRLPDGYSVPRLSFRGYILRGSFFPPPHAPRSLPASVAAALFRSRWPARYLSDGAGANSRHRHFFVALGAIKIVALYRGNRQAHSMLTCRACHQNLSNRHIFSPFGAEHKEDEMSTRSPDACENKQPLFDTPEQGRAEKRS